MLTNEQLKTMLLTDREAAFSQLYTDVFPVVARFVSRMGGSFQDARDVFQDAVIIFYEKIVEEQLTLEASAQGYIMGIARHLWHRTFQQGKHYIPLDGLYNLYDEEDTAEDVEAERLLIHYLTLAGEKCMDLLQSFYYLKMSMQEIARSFGFGSARSATVQKFKCLEKVRQKVKTVNHEEVFG